MRTNVTFRHPAAFVPLEEGNDVLAVAGAEWFAALLQRVPGLQRDGDLCQEDWGVVVFVRREEKSFWVGLSPWEGENTWLAHFHHGSFAWLQWFSAAGTNALRRLVSDVHAVLANEPTVSDIVWYEESQIRKAEPIGFPTPVDA
jgi:hypothetical protein